MELYTLVSLIIGIFGATYAALNALRTNFDVRVTEAIGAAKSEIEAMQLVAAQKDYDLTSCLKHQKMMGTARWWWLWANAVPAICFFVVMVFIVAGVFSHWDEVMTQHQQAGDLAKLKQNWPWANLQGCLEILSVVDLACVIAAGGALFVCFTRLNRVEEHHVSLRAGKFVNPTS